MVTALIVSGGKGTRMGGELPKQFLSLNGTPIIARTVMVYDGINEIDEIILVLPKAYFTYFKELNIKTQKPIRLAEAGLDRQESVFNGLLTMTSKDNNDIVIIHDGVRPLVTSEIIKKGIAFTKRYGSAACGVRPKDTLKKRESTGFSGETLPREEYVLIHTPQCFNVGDIIKAHREMHDQKRCFTDDTAIYEAVVGPVYLYDSSYENIKITTKEDLDVAKSILSRRSDNNKE